MVEHRWHDILKGLRADALDCLQSTLALIADDAYGPGTHLALGSGWRFPVPTADGRLVIQSSLQDRLADAVHLLGLRIGPMRHLADGADVRARLTKSGRLYVVADAFFLPWLPDAGYRHQPHSFLLQETDGRLLVVDAYHNDTQWGSARPCTRTVSARGLDQTLAEGALVVGIEPGELPSITRAAVLSGNAARARAAAPSIDAYAAGLHSQLEKSAVVEQLVLDAWILTRERLLHAAWLGEDAGAAEVAEQAAAWADLSMQSYLALRRLLREGRSVAALIEEMARLLHADAALVAQLEPTTGADESVTRAVVAVLCEVFALDEGVVRSAPTLRALPGFNSFGLVDAIDRLERSLGVRLINELAASDLQDVDGLCRVFNSAHRRQCQDIGTVP